MCLLYKNLNEILYIFQVLFNKFKPTNFNNINLHEY